MYYLGVQGTTRGGAITPWMGAPVKGGGKPPPFDSPDADAVVRRDPQRIGLGHVECLVPGIDIAQRREGADVPRRMRAVDQLLAQRFVAPQRAPDLRPAHEEALLAGETVDHRRILAVEGATVGLERDGQAAEVADVLAHRHL